MLGGGRRRRGRRRREEDAAEVRSVLGGAGLGEGGKRGDLSASPSLTHGNVFQNPTNENKKPAASSRSGLFEMRRERERTRERERERVIFLKATTSSPTSTPIPSHSLPFSPTVATAGLEIINIQPQVIATNLRFASYNAQGAREEKKSLFSF